MCSSDLETPEVSLVSSPCGASWDVRLTIGARPELARALKPSTCPERISCMDLYEYQARNLFRQHGVPVLDGAVATTPS